MENNLGDRCINEKCNDFVSCLVGFGYRGSLCMWCAYWLVHLDG